MHSIGPQPCRCPYLDLFAATMKKLLLPVLLSVLLLAVFFEKASAQLPGCNGRYKNAVFDSVTIIPTVAYGANLSYLGGNQFLYSDVYAPAFDSDSNRPAVFVLFGGSFVTGSRHSSGIPEFAIDLAKHGYVAIPIDYRIGISFPTSDEMSRAVYRATQDLLAAVRFYRKNARTYGIDSSQIFASGFSAGSITCLHAAFWDQNEVPAAINPALLGTLTNGSGTPGISSRLSGVLDMAGGIGDTNWINSNQIIPVGSVHDTLDSVVPYGYGVIPTVNLPIYGSSLLHKRINNLGFTSSNLYTLRTPGVHVPAIGSRDADTTTKYLESYLYSMLACNHAPVTALNNKEAAESLTLFPNPASGEAALRFNTPAEAGTLTVFTASGQALSTLNISAGTEVVKIPLQGLSAGFYGLRFASASRVLQKHFSIVD